MTPRSERREPVAGAGERVEAIIKAAEKAAAGIIEDADAQARRHIEASRRRADALADERVRVMSDLTDTLIRQAELVRRQSDELLDALERARGELASRIGEELTSAGADSDGPESIAEDLADVGSPRPRPSYLRAVESDPPTRATAAESDPPTRGTTEEARLLAAQMAVAGESREEIERRLRDELGVKDTSAIVDPILGKD